MKNRTTGVLATAVSGLSNLIVQLVVASLTTTEQFGLFAIASSTVIFLIGAGRAVVGQTDVLRGAGVTDMSPTAAAYLIAMITLIGGLILWFTGAVISNDVVVTIGIAVSLSTVFILQDGARFRCFRMQQSHIALASDSIVLGVALVGLVIANNLGIVAEAALAIWAGATALGLIAVMWRLRYWPTRSGWKWLVEHRDLVIPGLGEYGLQAGVPYLLNWLIIALGGLPALAGYRLIQLVFSAVSNLAQGLNAVTLPALVDSKDPGMARRALMREEFIVVATSLITLLAIVLIPEEWGTALFGANWLELDPFLLAGFIHGLANALFIHNFSMLRLLGLANFSFFVRVGSSIVTLILASGGAVTLGAPGVAWGMAFSAFGAYLVRAVKCRAVLARLIRQRMRIGQSTPKYDKS